MPNHILVIDDDQTICQLFKVILVNAGYDVTTAKDGKHGTRLFRQNEYDLVITDIVMPEKEGLETIREIRQIAGKGYPIIAISGGGQLDADHYLKTAKLMGADRTLGKPIDNTELLEVVQELLSKT